MTVENLLLFGLPVFVLLLLIWLDGQTKRGRRSTLDNDKGPSLWAWIGLQKDPLGALVLVIYAAALTLMGPLIAAILIQSLF